MSRNSYDASNNTLTPIGGWQSVDNALSPTSHNPLQNNVVTGAIGNIEQSVAPKEDDATISQDYAIGEQFYRANVLYKAKRAITSGTAWSNLVLDTDYELADNVTDQITSLKEALTDLQDDLTDIKVTGTTNNTGSTITSGTFFYLNGVLVVAKVDIANGATFTENTNYEVVTAGSLNYLNTQINNTVIEHFSLANVSLNKVMTSENVNVLMGRKISDYDFIYFNIGSNQNARGCYLVPRTFFANGQEVYVTFIYGGSIQEVDVKFISDTAVAVTNGTATVTTLSIYGIKLGR